MWWLPAWGSGPPLRIPICRIVGWLTKEQKNASALYYSINFPMFFLAELFPVDDWIICKCKMWKNVILVELVCIYTVYVWQEVSRYFVKLIGYCMSHKGFKLQLSWEIKSNLSAKHKNCIQQMLLTFSCKTVMSSCWFISWPSQLLMLCVRAWENKCELANSNKIH